MMIIDLTMCMLNRTAVYDIGLELAALRREDRVRYWRWITQRRVCFMSTPHSSLLGKALGRLAIRDVVSSFGPMWPHGRHAMLFVDPLFAVKTRIQSDDIVICHDIAPVSHPNFYDTGTGETYHTVYRKIQESRPGVVFVSEFTKRLFLELYPSNYRFTRVVPLYFKSALEGPASASFVHSDKKYFLMVGGMERRKNFAAAIDAFLTSGLPQMGYHLYIAGPRGNSSLEILSKIVGNPSVTHLGYISVGDLIALYRNSRGLFFPSLIEGFGVPALEATRLGTVAIVSANTVMSEIVGPDGITVDPTSLSSMIKGLHRVAAMSQAERTSQIAAVNDYQSRFSIENFRKAWLEILEAS